MPKEVLSYYLKNRNQRVRLGFQIALQCAPFLKGLKVSCVITMDEELCGTLPELFGGMNISWHMLSVSDGKCLVLFYRPGQMERYLSGAEVHSLLREYGYGGMELNEMFVRLSERVRDCSGKRMGFPHEIGVFLGYPLADVKGFIRHKGKNFTLCGCWKCYGDPKEAQRQFQRFKDCTSDYRRRFAHGATLRQLTVAA